MTIWQALGATYKEAGLFLFACPLLALVPVVVEMIQHIVEMRIGMYDSIAMAKQAEHDPWRMGFGMLKIIALLLPIYWVTRFIHFDRDAKRAAAWDATAVRLFAVYMLLQIAIAAIQLFALPATASWLLGTFVFTEIFAALTAAWCVAAPLGNPIIGLSASARMMTRFLPATILIFLAAMLPLMVPHYILGAAAIFGPAWSKWPILIVDSLLVGWLCAVLVASGYFAAKRAADTSGIKLAG